MNHKNFSLEQWLYYMKKEQKATSASTRVLFSKLKELYRDKVTAVNNSDIETIEYFAIIKYIDKQIKKNEEKLSIIMNLEVDLPEFYD